MTTAQLALTHDGHGDATAGPRAPTPKPGRFLREVLQQLLREDRAVRWVLTAAALEAAMDIATPWLSAQVVDVALPRQAPHMLGWIVFVVVLAAIQTAWLGWLRARATIALLSRTEVRCLESVVRRYLRAPFARIQHERFGDINETMGAVSGASSAIVEATLGSVTELLTLLVTLAMLSVWFPGLVAAVTVAALLMLAAASLYAMREARRAGRVLETSSRQQEMLHVLLRAVATLRVSGATRRFTERWSARLDDQAAAAIAQQETRIAQGLVFDGVPRLVWLLATAWLVQRVMDGETTLGGMMMGVTLSSNVMSSFVSLARSAVGFQAMRPHFARIDGLLARCEHAETGPATGLLTAPELVLDGVWFRYHDDAGWVLAGEQRRFPANQVSVVRAASGAGKTTMLRLLAGLLSPARGSVRVFGADASRTRQLVTYLPQRSHLLEASIATNLCVLSGQPLAASLAVAEHTGLARLLASLPMGVETIVGTAGANLSAGQAQLILLTAAFATSRPVVLLDEATSQLDPDTERLIDWQTLVRGRTVIMVRHD